MKSFFLFIISTVLLFSSCSQNKDLETNIDNLIYSGDSLKYIEFPIGGIGTGNFSLGGRGQIANIEIMNAANKQEPNMTFFTIYTETENGQSSSAFLERELFPPYTLEWRGYYRHKMPSVKRFDEVLFSGDFPFANLSFQDEDFPVHVGLEAYNPYVPLSVDMSSYPLAVFNWEVENPSSENMTVSIAFSMENIIKTKGSYCSSVNNGDVTGIIFQSGKDTGDKTKYGQVGIFSTGEKVEVQTGWASARWDSYRDFWKEFSDDGHISNLPEPTNEVKRGNIGTVNVSAQLKPGEKKVIPFYITWYFPYRTNNWTMPGWDHKPEYTEVFENYYAGLFNSAGDVVAKFLENEKELYDYSKKFKDAIANSSIPLSVKDAVLSQASTLKTNILVVDKSGYAHGFEGVADTEGSGFGNCTHVWNYAQTMAYLFPSLERSVRELSFTKDTWDNGYQCFRTMFPPDQKRWYEFHPAADGQMGNIVRLYREWLISGDNNWLKELYPKAKIALEFAWNGVGDVTEDFLWQEHEQPAPWDADKDGVMEGPQHNTYDCEYFGPNTMCGTVYLAALKAMGKMASVLGYQDDADEYKRLFESGTVKYEELLWNGEYYIHKVIVPDSSHVKAEKLYTDEKGEPQVKFQYENGCLSDQLLGQFIANSTSELGDLLDKEHMRSALLAVYKNNFTQNVGNENHIMRTYAMNNEAGLKLCTWKEEERPEYPSKYGDEVWTGIEYQVAASLIHYGCLEEAFDIVRAARDRYKGYNRNPWGEVEFGYHYARALSSWALLTELSGYEYNGVKKHLEFNPKTSQENFISFWSCGTAWGSIKISKEEITITPEFGALNLNTICVMDRQFKEVLLNSSPVEFKMEDGDAVFSKELIVEKNLSLVLK